MTLTIRVCSIKLQPNFLLKNQRVRHLTLSEFSFFFSFCPLRLLHLHFCDHEQTAWLFLPSYFLTRLFYLIRFLVSMQLSQSHPTTLSRAGPLIAVITMSNIWDRPQLYDDPFTSPAYPPKDNTFRWASRVARPCASSRFSSYRLSPVRVSVLLVTVAFVVFVRDHLPTSIYMGWQRKVCPI